VLRARERTPTPSLSVIFTFGLAIKSIKELEGASQHNQFTHNGWLKLSTHMEEMNKDENLSSKVKTLKTYAIVKSKISTHHFKHLPFMFVLYILSMKTLHANNFYFFSTMI
jgi:hypothetical protein